MGGLSMHPNSNAFRYFKGLVLAATLLALCVVSLGAYVRLTDAGLGCPDWPGCYGTLTVPQSEAAILQAQTTYPNSSVEVGKAWREMAHRYLAGTLGLFVLLIFVLGWKARNEIKSSPYTSSFLLLLIGFQAMLGMWTVTMLLKPAIVSGHLLGGMSTLALLSWLAHRHWGYYSDSIVTCQRLRLAIRLALVLLFMQIFLGGWTSTNYAALACTDFPTCHGAWVPDMDFSDAFHMVRELGLSKDGSALSLASLTAIQWTHRVGALVSFIYLGALGLTTLKYWQLQRWSFLLLGALITQIALGISNLVLHLPLVLAVAHNFTAALLVIIVVLLNSKISGGKAN